MDPYVAWLLDGVETNGVYLVEEDLPTYIIVTRRDEVIVSRMTISDPPVISDVNVVVLTPDEWENLETLNPGLKKLLEISRRVI